MKEIYLPVTRFKYLTFLFFFIASLACCIESMAQTQQVFTTSGAGTFTIPAGVTQVTVECWGGGGNGGQSTTNGVKAGGGGGGAYARKLLTVIPGNSYPLTVGAAGSDSWFSSNVTVLAKGGTTVAANATGGGAGGSAALSIGDQVYQGGNGANAGTGTGGGGSSAGNSAIGNNASGVTGGAAPGGGGAGANGLTGNGNGVSGNTPGGGGSGGWRQGAGSGGAGAGAVGRVVISYYLLTGTSTAASVCQNTAATVTLAGTPGNLPIGTYTVTYNLSGANTAVNATATMTVALAGTGTFTTASLAITGSTTVTITKLASVSSFYSSSIGSNNTATFNVTSPAQPTVAAGGPTAFCTGGSVLLTSSAGSTYKWYSDGVLIPAATSQTYTATTSAVYTVVVTNASGCISVPSADLTVTVNPLPATPSITANGPTTFCADGNVILSSTTATSYQWYKGGILIPGETNQDYSPTTSGIYTVVVTNINGCFSSPSSGISVTVNPLPAIPTISNATSTTFCDGSSVVLTSTAATTYQWYELSGIIIGQTNINYTANATGSYYVKVTNGFNCVATSAVKDVIVNPLPDIDVASQATGLCASASAQITPLAYTSTTNSPTTYSITWSSGPFVPVTGAPLLAAPNSISIAVPAGTAAGTYTGTLTVENSNGCVSANKIFTVTIASTPNVSNFSLTPPANGCVGVGAIITVNSTSLADGVYNVQYDLSGANTATNNIAVLTFSGNTGTFTAAALNAGATTIDVTEIALVGCSSPVTASSSFTINSLPALPTITGPTEVCVDATITLTPSSAGGLWSSAQPSIASINNSGVVTGLIGGVTTITYTTAPLNGCTNEGTYDITVNALPVVQPISGQLAYCVGSGATLTNATPNGTWSSSNNLIATIDNAGVVDALAVGSSVISYTTQSNAAGCFNVATANIVVNADPSVVVGTDVTVCESSSPLAITLSGASYSGGASAAFWTIESSGPGTLSNQGAGNFPQNVTYTPAANFYGTVTLKLTTNAVGTCGTASDTRLINITQKPTVIPGSPITVCQSASPSAITLSTAAVGGSATTGTWSIVAPGGGTLSDVTPVTDPANVTYTPAANFFGTVTLRLTTDAVGVCGTTSADRIVNLTENPTAIGGNQNSVCQSPTPGSVSLAGAGIGGGANTGVWTISLGSGTLSNVTPTANPGTVNFTPAANFTGTVKLTLTTDAPGGCTFTTAERIIDVTPASTVVAGGPDVVCQSATPGAITLSGAGVAGGATTGTWSASVGTLSSTNPETAPGTVTYTPDVNYTGTVSLLLTTNATGNCPAVNATRTITVNPNAIITLTSAAATTSQTPCINTAITSITYSVSGGATGATATGLPAGLAQSFSAGVLTISGTPTVAGPFSYTVTTTGGTCSPASATGTITVSALTVGGTISPASSSPLTVCSGANSGSLTLSGNVGSIVRWEKSVNGGISWTNIVNTTTTETYTNITQTTLYRALVQNGVCGTAYSALGQLVVLPPFTPVISASATSTCLGVPITLTASGYSSTGLVIADGDFPSPSPAGWSGNSGNASNNSTGNPVNAVWGITNNIGSYNGVTYVSSPANNKFMIVNGAVNSALATPTFSLIGMSSAYLTFNEGYNFSAGTVARIEISTDGGTTWTTLKNYIVPSPATTTNPLGTATPIDINSYLGLSNLKIRFNYQGTALSNWALDNVIITNNFTTNPGGTNPYNPLSYTWSPTTYLSSSTTNPTTVTPTVAGSITYTVSAAVGACASTTTSAGILITFNPNPVITAMTATACSGTAFTATPVNGTNGTVPAGTTYTWTAPVVTGGITGGTAQAAAQTSISQTLTNPGTAPATATYTVTPKSGTCTGTTFTVTVTVSPKSTITPMTTAICSASTFTVTPVNVTNGVVVPGTTYSWAAPVVTGGMTGGAAGSGASDITGTLTNASVTAQTGTYTVTPLSGTCAGASFTVTATISPATAPGTLPASLFVCTAGTNPLNLTGSVGSVLRWESSTDNGVSWNNIGNANLTTINVNVVAATTLYRAVVQSGTCLLDYSTVAKAGLKNYWTGAVSTDWLIGNNWSEGAVPAVDLSCPTVTIPTGAPRMPTLSSGTSTILNLSIQSAASATISGTGLLTIGGTITKAATGTFDVTNGSLEFNGSSAQSIDGTMFVGSNIKNLRISNQTPTGLSITGTAINVLGDLDFGAGSSTLTTNDNLVLRSTATSTARIADITNGGLYGGNKFIGKVTVERFFPGNRSWRLLTAPVSRTGNIFNSWQNSGVYTPGIGMFVSGLSPNTATNGLDYSVQNNFSMKGWDMALQNYANVTNTLTTNLSDSGANAANKAFFTFVRGDRSRTPDNTIIPNTNNTTLSSKGLLQTGTQTFAASSVADAFAMIGNPYASPVDMAKITLTNVARRFTVWDPTLNEVGGFVTMEDADNDNVFTSTPINLGSQDNHIQSSQAFFVQTIASAPASVKFEETHKSATNNLLLFRPASPAERKSIAVYLYKHKADNTLYKADGTYVEFSNSYNNGVDIADAPKLINVNETFGLVRDGKFLAVERRPEIMGNDTVYLKLTKTTRRKYHFEVLPQKISQDNLTAFIEDKFLQTKTPLSLESQTDVDFEVTTDAASAAADRFKIVFRPSAVYTDIDAKVVNADIAVNWSVSSEFNIQHYDVERSVDGTNFTKLNEKLAAKNDYTDAAYNSVDASPAIGTYYYRIKSISNTGVIGYSKTVKVKINKSTPVMYVLPNPVTNNIIHVQMNSLPAGVYDARLLTTTGQLVFADIISHAPGTATETLVPKRKLTAGIYHLKVTAPDKRVTVIKVAVE